MKLKPGRKKGIKTPEIMQEMFNSYKLFRKSNPRQKFHLNQRTGDMVAEPLEVPLTFEGFTIFSHNKYNVSIQEYFHNQKSRQGVYEDSGYEIFADVCSRIKMEIREDQIIGGMVGQYNPSITQRLNSLHEHVVAVNIEQPLFPEGDESPTLGLDPVEKANLMIEDQGIKNKKK